MTRVRDNHLTEEPPSQALRTEQMVKSHKLLLDALGEAQKKFIAMGMTKAAAGRHACRLFELHEVEEEDFEEKPTSSTQARSSK